MNAQSERKTASDEIILPHQRFDIVAKDPFYTYPEDMLRFLMGNKEFEFIEHVDTNLTNVDVRQMDILLKILIDEQPVLIHCEIQTDDSGQPNMVQRNDNPDLCNTFHCKLVDNLTWFNAMLVISADAMKNMDCQSIPTCFI